MTEEKQGYTRREMLKITAAAGSGLMIGASGFGLLSHLIDDQIKETVAEPKKASSIIPFYGQHQAGIVTPLQSYAYVTAFDITTNDRKKVIQLFKDWTKLASLMAKGNWAQNDPNNLLPPNDTGETLGMSAANLTFTFGLGPTFFKKKGVDRFSVAHKQPRHLKDIPRMPHDNLDKELSGGDLCVQVSALDQQVAFHAIRNFNKAGVGTVMVKWMEKGFINGPKGETPRNLFGFKDGTANVKTSDTSAQQKLVWADEGEPAWMKGGSYLAYRKIRMFLEVWDRSSLQDQEDTFGRRKQSGAPYGKVSEHDAVDMNELPTDSHVRLAKSTGQKIFRRAYSYTDEIDPATGDMRAGLLFLSYQKNPEESFIPMLKLLSKKDALNEYTQHIGSAMFACPRGIQKGEYVAQGLFEGL